MSTLTPRGIVAELDKFVVGQEQAKRMIFRARDDDDAVRIANDTPFGLGGSVFSKDAKHARAVADRIETGMVFVNHPTMVKADIPFGGIKRSGYGRELIGLGIKEFVNHKVTGIVDIDAEF